MSISLGTLSFGVEADTSKLDKDINKSEQKISRFSMLGLQRLNALSSFNINSGTKKIESLNEKIDKLKSKSSEAVGKLEEIDQKMRNIRADIAETSGLNLQYDASQNTDNRMTTTQYDEKLEKLAMQNREYQKLVAQEQNLFNKTQQHSAEITKINGKIATIKNNISKASKVQGISNTFTSIGAGLKTIGTKLGGVISKTIKWGTILFGVGGAISFITRGVNAYLDANPQIKANLDYMTYSIGQALAPAIQWVVNLFQQLLGIIGAIAQVFFGVNLFANSLSNYMKSANKNASGMKKSLGSLAGFDEINNIGGDTTTNGVSGITVPNMPDLSSIMDSWIPKIQQVKNLFDEWKWAILGVVVALSLLKLGSILGASIPMLMGIVAVFVGLGFVIQGIVNMLNGDFVTGLSQFLIGLGIFALGVLLIFGAIPALITIIVGLVILAVVIIIKNWDAIKEFFIKTWNHICEFFTKIWNWICEKATGLGQWFSDVWEKIKTTFGNVWDWIKTKFNNFWTWICEKVNNLKQRFLDVWEKIKQSFSNIWNNAKTLFSNFWSWICEKAHNIGDTFTNIWENIKNGFINVWNKIKEFAGNIGTTVANAVGGTIKSVVNSIIGFAEKTINGFIKAINLAISVINAIPGVNISKINLLNIPRLAGGNVATKETLAIFGEYAGAKSNPEVTAPQSIIYQTTKEAMKDSGNFNNTDEQKLVHLTMIVDSKKTFDEIIEEGREYERKNGVKIFAN